MPAYDNDSDAVYGRDEADFGYGYRRPSADAWDSLNDDNYPDDEDGWQPHCVKCRNCGATCTWHPTGVRWALMGDDGRLHKCAAGTAVDPSRAIFENLDE